MCSDDNDKPLESRSVEVSLGGGWRRREHVQADGSVTSHTLPYHRREDGDDAREVQYLKSTGYHCATDEQGRIVEIAILAEDGRPAVAEVLDTISGLRHVQELSINAWKGTDESLVLNDSALQHLAYWKELQSVDFSTRPNISGEGFQRLLSVNPLPKLEVLKIHTLGRDDRVLKSLSSANRLKKLEIGLSDASDEGVACLSTLPSLSQLMIKKSSNLSGSGFSGLDGFNVLASLNVGDCQISDAGLARISSIPTLVDLMLSSESVSDYGVRQLARLCGIQRLSLSKTGVSVDGLRSLLPCTKLETLFVSKTALGNEALPVLFQMESLRTVFAYGTKITEAGIAAHRGSANLEIEI